ncbi:coniferyl-alcohol dehydrogenase [Mesorhizobium sp. ORM6]
MIRRVESAVLCEKMEKPLKLAGKTVVVTGVCSGVGAEVARLARCEGARLIGVDLEDPVVMLDAFFRIDQGSPEEIDAALTQFPERIDGLVNAAGVSGTLDRDIVARVNYLGIRHLSHALACRMPEGSSIVNFACLLDPEWPKRVDLHKELAATQSFTDGLAWLAANPVPQETCYRYFREAVMVWSARASVDLYRRRGVRMNTVAPEPDLTVLGDFFTTRGRKAVEGDIGRFVGPIAPAHQGIGPVVFLLSDEACFVHGANVTIRSSLAGARLQA